MLFSTESAQTGCTPGKAEVYTIPGDTYDLNALKKALATLGYSLDPLPSDDKIYLANGNGQKFMVYYSKESGWSDLYIASCIPGAEPGPVPSASGSGQTAGIAPPVNDPATTPPAPVQASAGISGFQFNTSNFDDGWVARIEPEWVIVENGNARVYLFFVLPYNSDKFSGTGMVDRDYYWDDHVARIFSATGKRYKDDGEFVSALQPKYVEGNGIDPKTGDPCFIAMHLAVGVNAAMITVASFPDEQSFRQQFPRANDRYTSDLAAMSRYNKFAIGPRDLPGTWQSGGTQMTQWYDARTGAYAGATLAATSATFIFMDKGRYESIHNGATGAVGAMNSFQQEYKGTYSVTNWEITATGRYEGRTDKFDAHLQAVRGGRLLFLNDNKGGKYLLVKVR